MVVVENGSKAISILSKHLVSCSSGPSNNVEGTSCKSYDKVQDQKIFNEKYCLPHNKGLCGIKSEMSLD